MYQSKNGEIVVHLYQMLYLTSLSYIDLVPYVHFNTKYNLYTNEHALNAWLIVLHISWISC